MRGRFVRPSHTPIKAWYERDGGTRLSADRALVAEFYPTLQFRIDDSRADVSLNGNIVIVADCGVRSVIATCIKFLWDYPRSEPIAFDSNKRFKAWPGKKIIDRHIFQDGRCCLWLPPRTRWSSQDPLALRSFLDELVVFFHRQLISDITLNWQGSEYDHGPDGYRQFISEQLDNDDALATALLPVIAMQTSVGRNDPCPCGAGKKFKQCHLRTVKEIQKQIGWESIKQIFVPKNANGRLNT